MSEIDNPKDMIDHHFGCTIKSDAASPGGGIVLSDVFANAGISLKNSVYANDAHCIATGASDRVTKVGEDNSSNVVYHVRDSLSLLTQGILFSHSGEGEKLKQFRTTVGIQLLVLDQKAIHTRHAELANVMAAHGKPVVYYDADAEHQPVKQRNAKILDGIVRGDIVPPFLMIGMSSSVSAALESLEMTMDGDFGYLNGYWADEEIVKKKTEDVKIDGSWVDFGMIRSVLSKHDMELLSKAVDWKFVPNKDKEPRREEIENFMESLDRAEAMGMMGRLTRCVLRDIVRYRKAVAKEGKDA